MNHLPCLRLFHSKQHHPASLQSGFIGISTLIILGVLVGSIAIITTRVVQQNPINLPGRAASGSCQGVPPPGCTVSGYAIGGCDGRSQSNCTAVASCGCSWVSDQPTAPAAPTQPPAPQPTQIPGCNVQAECSTENEERCTSGQKYICQKVNLSTACTNILLWRSSGACNTPTPAPTSSQPQPTLPPDQPNVCSTGSASGCEGVTFGGVNRTVSSLCCYQSFPGTTDKRCGRNDCSAGGLIQPTSPPTDPCGGRSTGSYWCEGSTSKYCVVAGIAGVPTSDVTCSLGQSCVSNSARCVNNTPTSPPTDPCGGRGTGSYWCEGNTSKYCVAAGGAVSTQPCNTGTTCVASSSRCLTTPIDAPQTCSVSGARECRNGRYYWCADGQWSETGPCPTALPTQTPIPSMRYSCNPSTCKCTIDTNGSCWLSASQCRSACLNRQTPTPIPTKIPTQTPLPRPRYSCDSNCNCIQSAFGSCTLNLTTCRQECLNNRPTQTPRPTSIILPTPTYTPRPTPSIRPTSFLLPTPSFVPSPSATPRPRYSCDSNCNCTRTQSVFGSCVSSLATCRQECLDLKITPLPTRAPAPTLYTPRTLPPVTPLPTPTTPLYAPLNAQCTENYQCESLWCSNGSCTQKDRCRTGTGFLDYIWASEPCGTCPYGFETRSDGGTHCRTSPAPTPPPIAINTRIPTPSLGATPTGAAQPTIKDTLAKPVQEPTPTRKPFLSSVAQEITSFFTPNTQITPSVTTKGATKLTPTPTNNTVTSKITTFLNTVFSPQPSPAPAVFKPVSSPTAATNLITTLQEQRLRIFQECSRETSEQSEQACIWNAQTQLAAIEAKITNTLPATGCTETGCKTLREEIASNVRNTYGQQVLTLQEQATQTEQTYVEKMQQCETITDESQQERCYQRVTSQRNVTVNTIIQQSPLCAGAKEASCRELAVTSQATVQDQYELQKNIYEAYERIDALQSECDQATDPQEQINCYITISKQIATEQSNIQQFINTNASCKEEAKLYCNSIANTAREAVIGSPQVAQDNSTPTPTQFTDIQIINRITELEIAAFQARENGNIDLYNSLKTDQQAFIREQCVDNLSDCQKLQGEIALAVSEHQQFASQFTELEQQRLEIMYQGCIRDPNDPEAFGTCFHHQRQLLAEISEEKQTLSQSLYCIQNPQICSQIINQLTETTNTLIEENEERKRDVTQFVNNYYALSNQLLVCEDAIAAGLTTCSDSEIQRLERILQSARNQVSSCSANDVVCTRKHENINAITSGTQDQPGLDQRIAQINNIYREYNRVQETLQDQRYGNEIYVIPLNNTTCLISTPQYPSGLRISCNDVNNYLLVPLTVDEQAQLRQTNEGQSSIVYRDVSQSRTRLIREEEYDCGYGMTCTNRIYEIYLCESDGVTCAWVEPTSLPNYDLYTPLGGLEITDPTLSEPERTVLRNIAIGTVYEPGSEDIRQEIGQYRQIEYQQFLGEVETQARFDFAGRALQQINLLDGYINTTDLAALAAAGMVLARGQEQTAQDISDLIFTRAAVEYTANQAVNFLTAPISEAPEHFINTVGGMVVTFNSAMYGQDRTAANIFDWNVRNSGFTNAVNTFAENVLTNAMSGNLSLNPLEALDPEVQANLAVAILGTNIGYAAQAGSQADDIGTRLVENIQNPDVLLYSVSAASDFTQPLWAANSARVANSLFSNSNIVNRSIAVASAALTGAAPTNTSLPRYFLQTLPRFVGNEYIFEEAIVSPIVTNVGENTLGNMLQTLGANPQIARLFSNLVSDIFIGEQVGEISLGAETFNVDTPRNINYVNNLNNTNTRTNTLPSNLSFTPVDTTSLSSFNALESFDLDQQTGSLGNFTLPSALDVAQNTPLSSFTDTNMSPEAQAFNAMIAQAAARNQSRQPWSYPGTTFSQTTGTTRGTAVSPLSTIETDAFAFVDPTANGIDTRQYLPQQSPTINLTTEQLNALSAAFDPTSVANTRPVTTTQTVTSAQLAALALAFDPTTSLNDTRRYINTPPLINQMAPTNTNTSAIVPYAALDLATVDVSESDTPSLADRLFNNNPQSIGAVMTGQTQLTNPELAAVALSGLNAFDVTSVTNPNAPVGNQGPLAVNPNTDTNQQSAPNPVVNQNLQPAPIAPDPNQQAQTAPDTNQQPDSPDTQTVNAPQNPIAHTVDQVLETAQGIAESLPPAIGGPFTTILTGIQSALSQQTDPTIADSTTQAPQGNPRQPEGQQETGNTDQQADTKQGQGTNSTVDTSGGNVQADPNADNQQTQQDQNISDTNTTTSNTTENETTQSIKSPNIIQRVITYLTPANPRKAAQILADASQNNQSPLQTTTIDGTTRPALIQAVAREVKNSAGETLSVTELHVTQAGLDAGLRQKDFNSFNESSAEFSQWKNSVDNNFRGFRINQNTNRSQDLFLVDTFIHTFDANSNGRIVGALPGVGKELLIQYEIYLRLKYGSDPIFHLQPRDALLSQFLVLDSEGNSQFVNFLETELGLTADQILIARADTQLTPAQINSARLVLTTKEIAFQLQNVEGNQAGVALRDKWRNSWQISDEGHDTNNAFESYQISKGTPVSTLSTPEGSAFATILPDLRSRITSLEAMITARINKQAVTGLDVTTDGVGTYTDAKQAEILLEWLTTQDNLDSSLQQDVQAIITKLETVTSNPQAESVDVDLADIRSSIETLLQNNSTDPNVRQNIETLTSELTLINTMATVLSQIPGIQYGVVAVEGKNNTTTQSVAPLAQGEESGRRYQQIAEQIVYHTVGAEILGVSLTQTDLAALTISPDSRTINMAQLLGETKGNSIYTGTPEQIAFQFQAFGINVTQFGMNAFDEAMARVGGQEGSNARVYTDLSSVIANTQNARSGRPQGINRVYINLDSTQSDAETIRAIAQAEGTSPNKPFFVIGGPGQFSEGTIVNGEFVSTQTYNTKDEVNARIGELDAQGIAYTKFYEFRAFKGVDTFNSSELSQGIVLINNANQTDAAQAINRIRVDRTTNQFAPVSLVYLGNEPNVTTIGALTEVLAREESKQTQLAQVRFAETLITNGPFAIIDEILMAETRAGRAKGSLATSLTTLRNTWNRTLAQQASLTQTNITAEAKLEQALSRAQAMYSQLETAVANSRSARGIFNTYADGYKNATIDLSLNGTTSALNGTSSIADIVNYVNTTLDANELADITFTDRGPSATVITQDSIRALEEQQAPQTEDNIALDKGDVVETPLTTTPTKPTLIQQIANAIQKPFTFLTNLFTTTNPDTVVNESEENLLPTPQLGQNKEKEQDEEQNDTIKVQLSSVIASSVENPQVGQLIKNNDKYFTVSSLENGLGLTEVIRLNYSDRRLGNNLNSIADGFPSMLARYDSSNGSYYYKGVNGEEIEIPAKGLLFSNGIFIRPSSNPGFITVNRYTTEIYNFQENILLKFQDGQYFIDNLTAQEGSYSFTPIMVNDEIKSDESKIPIQIGDVITTPNGKTYKLVQTPQGIELQSAFIQTNKMKEYSLLIEKINDLMTNERIESIGSELIRLGYSASSLTPYLNSDGTINANKLLTTTRGISESFQTRDTANSIILRTIFNSLSQDTEFAELYKSLIQNNLAYQIHLINFRIKFIEYYMNKITLFESIKTYYESLLKMQKMWNLIASFNPEAEDYITLLLNELTPNQYLSKQANQILTNIEQYNFADPVLAASFPRKSFFDSPYELYTDLMRNVYYGRLAEQSFALSLMPNGFSEHENTYYNFWTTILAEQNINISSWMNSQQYSFDDLNVAFEFTFNPEMLGPDLLTAANAGGYIGIGLFSKENIAHILNHEATHKMISHPQSPRNLQPNQVVPQNEKHNEIVTELISLVIDQQSFSYPTNPGNSAYSKGVQELLSLLQEIDQHKGATNYGLTLLINGVIQFNEGILSYPLELVQNYYSQTMERSDFFTRLAPYENSIYYSTRRIVENPEVIQTPIIKENSQIKVNDNPYIEVSNILNSVTDTIVDALNSVQNSLDTIPGILDVMTNPIEGIIKQISDLINPLDEQPENQFIISDQAQEQQAIKTQQQESDSDLQQEEQNPAPTPGLPQNSQSDSSSQQINNTVNPIRNFLQAFRGRLLGNQKSTLEFTLSPENIDVPSAEIDNLTIYNTNPSHDNFYALSQQLTQAMNDKIPITLPSKPGNIRTMVIVGELGQGSFATVYEIQMYVNNQPTGPPQVIRVPLGKNINDHTYTLRGTVLQKLLSSLTYFHPIPVDEIIYMNDIPIVLSPKLISLESIYQELHQNPTRIRAFNEQLIRALQEFHKQGQMVHSDISLNNMYLDKNDTLYFGDLDSIYIDPNPTTSLAQQAVNILTKLNLPPSKTPLHGFKPEYASFNLTTGTISEFTDYVALAIINHYLLFGHESDYSTSLLLNDFTAFNAPSQSEQRAIFNIIKAIQEGEIQAISLGKLFLANNFPDTLLRLATDPRSTYKKQFTNQPIDLDTSIFSDESEILSDTDNPVFHQRSQLQYLTNENELRQFINQSIGSIGLSTIPVKVSEDKALEYKILIVQQSLEYTDVLEAFTKQSSATVNHFSNTGVIYIPQSQNSTVSNLLARLLAINHEYQSLVLEGIDPTDAIDIQAYADHSSLEYLNILASSPTVQNSSELSTVVLAFADQYMSNLTPDSPLYMQALNFYESIYKNLEQQTQQPDATQRIHPLNNDPDNLSTKPLPAFILTPQSVLSGLPLLIIGANIVPEILPRAIPTLENWSERGPPLSWISNTLLPLAQQAEAIKTGTSNSPIRFFYWKIVLDKVNSRPQGSTTPSPTQGNYTIKASDILNNLSAEDAALVESSGFTNTTLSFTVPPSLLEERMSQNDISLQQAQKELVEELLLSAKHIALFTPGWTGETENPAFRDTAQWYFSQLPENERESALFILTDGPVNGKFTTTKGAISPYGFSRYIHVIAKSLNLLEPIKVTKSEPAIHRDVSFIGHSMGGMQVLHQAAALAQMRQDPRLAYHFVAINPAYGHEAQWWASPRYAGRIDKKLVALLSQNTYRLRALLGWIPLYSYMERAIARGIVQFYFLPGADKAVRDSHVDAFLRNPQEAAKGARGSANDENKLTKEEWEAIKQTYPNNIQIFTTQDDNMVNTPTAVRLIKEDGGITPHVFEDGNHYAVITDQDKLQTITIYKTSESDIETEKVKTSIETSSNVIHPLYLEYDPLQQENKRVPLALPGLEAFAYALPAIPASIIGINIGAEIIPQAIPTLKTWSERNSQFASLSKILLQIAYRFENIKNGISDLSVLYWRNLGTTVQNKSPHTSLPDTIDWKRTDRAYWKNLINLTKMGYQDQIIDRIPLDFTINFSEKNPEYWDFINVYSLFLQNSIPNQIMINHTITSHSYWGFISIARNSRNLKFPSNFLLNTNSQDYVYWEIIKDFLTQNPDLIQQLLFTQPIKGNSNNINYWNLLISLVQKESITITQSEFSQLMIDPGITNEDYWRFYSYLLNRVELTNAEILLPKNFQINTKHPNIYYWNFLSIIANKNPESLLKYVPNNLDFGNIGNNYEIASGFIYTLLELKLIRNPSQLIPKEINITSINPTYWMLLNSLAEQYPEQISKLLPKNINYLDPALVASNLDLWKLLFTLTKNPNNTEITEIIQSLKIDVQNNNFDYWSALYNLLYMDTDANIFNSLLFDSLIDNTNINEDYWVFMLEAAQLNRFSDTSFISSIHPILLQTDKVVAALTRFAYSNSMEELTSMLPKIANIDVVTRVIYQFYEAYHSLGNLEYLQPYLEKYLYDQNFPIYFQKITSDPRITPSTKPQVITQIISSIVTGVDNQSKTFMGKLVKGEKPQPEEYIYYVILLKQIDNDFYTNLVDIIHTLNLDITNKTILEIIPEIDAQIPNIPINSYTSTFQIQTQQISIPVSDSLISSLKILANITQPDVPVSFAALKTQYQQFTMDLLYYKKLISYELTEQEEETLTQLLQDNPPFNTIEEFYLKYNVDLRLQSKRPDNIINYIYSTHPIFKLSKDQQEYIIAIFLSRLDPELLSLFQNPNAVISQSEASLFMLSLNQFKQELTTIFEELELENYPDRAVTSYILSNLSSEQTFKQLLSVISQTINEQIAYKKEIDTFRVIYTPKNLLDLYQGFCSGTCFQDHPYDMIRPGILVGRLIKNDQLIGDILFTVQESNSQKQLVLIGFDPSLSFWSSVDDETKRNYINHVMTSITDFAQANNMQFIITDEAGSLSNKSDIQDYIFMQFVNSYKLIDLAEETFHPDYKYTIKSGYEAK